MKPTSLFLSVFLLLLCSCEVDTKSKNDKATSEEVRIDNGLLDSDIVLGDTLFRGFREGMTQSIVDEQLKNTQCFFEIQAKKIYFNLDFQFDDAHGLEKVTLYYGDTTNRISSGYSDEILNLYKMKYFFDKFEIIYENMEGEIPYIKGSYFDLPDFKTTAYYNDEKIIIEHNNKYEVISIFMKYGSERYRKWLETASWHEKIIYDEPLQKGLGEGITSPEAWSFEEIYISYCSHEIYNQYLLELKNTIPIGNKTIRLEQEREKARIMDSISEQARQIKLQQSLDAI